MQAPEQDTQAVAQTAAEHGAADPFSDAALGETLPRLSELLGRAQETARAMAEAEDALRLVRERFQHTEDPQLQGDLAAEALDQVERQLQLTSQRRQGLDSIEGKLWTRRNRLERFLIHTRGRAWWQARRNPARAETAASR
jgi:enoyl-CoA hydratase/carnithine racemase